VRLFTGSILALSFQKTTTNHQTYLWQRSSFILKLLLFSGVLYYSVPLVFIVTLFFLLIKAVLIFRR